MNFVVMKGSQCISACQCQEIGPYYRPLFFYVLGNPDLFWWLEVWMVQDMVEITSRSCFRNPSSNDKKEAMKTKQENDDFAF